MNVIGGVLGFFYINQHAVGKKGFVMAILSSVLKRTLKREERLMQINKNAQKYVL